MNDIHSEICDRVAEKLGLHKEVVYHCYMSMFKTVQLHIKNVDYLFDETEIHPDDAIECVRIPNLGKFAPKEGDVNRLRVDNNCNPVSLIIPGTNAGFNRRKIRDDSGYAPRKEPVRGQKGTYTAKMAEYQKAYRERKKMKEENAQEQKSEQPTNNDSQLSIKSLLRGVNRR